MTTYNQDSRDLNIKIEGKTGEDELGNNYVLLSEILDGSYQELSEQFHIKLVLLSPAIYSPLTADEMLGRNTTVKIKKDDDTWRIINGVLSKFVLKGYYSYTEQGEKIYNPDLYEYRAVLSPKMLLMKNSLKSRIFHSKKPTAVIEQILDEWNIDYDDKLTYDSGDDAKTYYEIDQIVQYRESDFDFVSRLMQKEGIHYYFWQGEEDDNEVHKLILRDSNPSSELDLTYDYSGGSNYVTSFRLGEKVGPNSVRIDNYDYRQADVTFFNYDDSNVNQDTDLGSYASKMQVNEFEVDFISTADKAKASKYRKKLLKLESQRLRCANYKWKGKTRNRSIAPGIAFTMTGYPADDINGLITRLELTAKTTPYSTLNGTVSEDTDADFKAVFYAQDSGQVFRPQLTIKDPEIFATTNARIITVENIPTDLTDFNSDLGGNPVLLDTSTTRVKILMNWRNIQSDNNPDFSSMWLNARFGQIWADPTSGSFDIPRKGQEVLVTFVNGNPAQPVVVGSLYNSVVTPPIDASITGGVYSSVMRTAAISGNDDDGSYAVTSSTLNNTMPLPMSAYDLGQSKNQKGYSEISMYSLNNGGFSNAEYDDATFMCKWFFPADAPAISTLVGYGKDGVSSDPDPNMFFEGINMYSNKDVMTQAAQRQVINAGSNVQISAGGTITLQAGRSSITLTDEGIFLKNAFGDQNKYNGYLSDYAAVDPSPPSAPSWSLNSFSSQFLLVPGLGLAQAPLTSIVGTYHANIKTWWGSEAGGMIATSKLAGMHTTVTGGFDLTDCIITMNKMFNEINKDICTNAGTDAGAWAGTVGDAGLNLFIQTLLIQFALCIVAETINMISVIMAGTASQADLKYNLMELCGNNVCSVAPKISGLGNPYGGYIALYKSIRKLLTGGLGEAANAVAPDPLEAALRNAVLTREDITIVSKSELAPLSEESSVNDVSINLNEEEAAIAKQKLKADEVQLEVCDNKSIVIESEQNIVEEEAAISSVDQKVSDSSAAAIRQNMKALDQESRALITAYAGLDVEL
ncbi:type VI secretion system tip protein TssI/VgrG [Lentisphaerota bacterium ZTH]|nr:type VI secretion system tip protein VgrG [Lentisphaerota bacterium]WET05338.1 type VI secretion system tip protein TssI/VgrG [Lentisphaerota bacterium ZTH]